MQFDYSGTYLPSSKIYLPGQGGLIHHACYVAGEASIVKLSGHKRKGTDHLKVQIPQKSRY